MPRRCAQCGQPFDPEGKIIIYCGKCQRRHEEAVAAAQGGVADNQVRTSDGGVLTFHYGKIPTE